MTHDKLNVDCPCGPTVLKTCDQCNDEGNEEGTDSRCWLCDGTKQTPAHRYDIEKIRASVVEKGLVPSEYSIVHKTPDGAATEGDS